MENCTDAKTSAEYLASRSSLYTYNMNGFVTDDKNTFCVELVVGDKDGRTVIRDSKTKLNDGIKWTDPDCFCVVNSFAAEGNSDMIDGIETNYVRWRKYDRLFSSEKEKISLARSKNS